ncbi:MAG: class I SAM-dependent methyltransferase [Xanthobacteraceae bacterium]
MERAGWNLHADNFETKVCDILAEGNSSNAQLSRMVRAACGSRKNLTLVDFGCGVGTFIERFGDRFKDIVGVEFAPKICARAEKRCADMEHVTWHALDIVKAAKLIGRRADLTVCLNVITSPSKAKRNALWAAVASVTKAQGHLLLVVPSTESDDMVNSLEPDYEPGRAGGLVERDGIYQKHYKREELIAVLSDFGFNTKSIARAFYPWSIEGIRKPRAAGNRYPWDWMCLAQRVEN